MIEFLEKASKIMQRHDIKNSTYSTRTYVQMNRKVHEAKRVPSRMVLLNITELFWLVYQMGMDFYTYFMFRKSDEELYIYADLMRKMGMDVSVI